MKLLQLAILFMLFLAIEVSAEKPGVYKGKVFLGISGGSVKLDEDPRYESTHGILLGRVPAGSTGDGVGLKKGDILVSIDGVSWANDQIRLSQSFGKAGQKATPGQKVTLMVLKSEKDKNGKRLLEEIEAELLLYPRTQAEKGGAPSNDTMRPDLKDTNPIYRELCWNHIRSNDFEPGCLDLLDRLDRSQQFPDPDRLPIVRYTCRDPFKLEAVSDEIIERLKPQRPLGVGDCEIFIDTIEHILVSFDRQSKSKALRKSLPKSYLGKDLKGHIDYVEKVLSAAAKEHKKAFAALSESEIQYILGNRNHMLDSFTTFKMLSYDPDYQRQKASLKVLDLAAKVDTASLIEQSRIVSLLVSPSFTSSLKNAAEKSGADLNVDVVLKRDTDYGTILIGGHGRQRYGDKDYAVMYELGGDDVYANNQASSVWPSIPSAVIVDYAGDDAYESNDISKKPWGTAKNVYGNEAAKITKGGFSQGCGDLGTGILVDLSGNDNYIGLSFTQGAGFLGIGMLFDQSGDDVYRGVQLHQAIGQHGAGLLVDTAGKDRYESLMLAQGVGLAAGCGILYDGGEEGDSYYCKGKQPTGYGTAGVFEGWGQAVGIGYRPFASGGVGIIYDRAGADRMEAGNFSQGGGYYYGLGMLLIGGNDDDHYIGSRYAQGFTAHQGAAVMIESGGDDRYSTRNGVAQGIAWDESVTLFIEKAGDDIYEGSFFSQGASANNAWAIFLDMEGKDTYLYCDQARNSDNSYHGGKSMSFFVDAGGDDDSYPYKKNNSVDTGGEYFIFADLPGSLAEALQKNESGDSME